MCGLVGVAGNLYQRDLAVFNNLLIMNQLRGRDSTGVAGMTSGGNVTMIKRVGGPENIMDAKWYDQVVTTGKDCLIGHGRARTVGTISSANAHPFEFPGLVGAHNGTIDHAARRFLLNEDQYGTDSEALLYTIEMLGLNNAIPQVWGAWALTIYDKTEHSIKFLRNKERSLFYVIAESGQTIYWASEYGMLYSALTRNNVAFDKVELVPENVLLTFAIPKTGKSFEDAERTTILGGEERPPVWAGKSSTGSSSTSAHTNTSGANQTAVPFDATRRISGTTSSSQPGGNTTPGTSGRSGTANSRTFSRVNERAKTNVVELRPNLRQKPDGQISFDPLGTLRFVMGPHKSMINNHEFIRHTKDGCVWCETKVTWDDVSKGTSLVWIKHPEGVSFLCQDCMGVPEIVKYMAENVDPNIMQEAV